LKKTEKYGIINIYYFRRYLTMKKLRVTLSQIEDVKKFCGYTNSVEYECDIATGRYVVSAKSIMGIFSLDLTAPLDLTIYSDNCADLLEKIKPYIVD
jgi:hypothetical protein